MASMDLPHDVPDTKFTLDQKERKVKMVKEEANFCAAGCEAQRQSRMPTRAQLQLRPCSPDLP